LVTYSPVYKSLGTGSTHEATFTSREAKVKETPGMGGGGGVVLGWVTHTSLWGGRKRGGALRGGRGIGGRWMFFFVGGEGKIKVGGDAKKLVGGGTERRGNNKGENDPRGFKKIGKIEGGGKKIRRGVSKVGQEGYKGVWGDNSRANCWGGPP